MPFITIDKVQIELVEGFYGMADFSGDVFNENSMLVTNAVNPNYYTYFRKTSKTYEATDGTTYYQWKATNHSSPFNSDIAWAAGTLLYTIRDIMSLWSSADIFTITEGPINLETTVDFNTYDASSGILKDAFDNFEFYHCGEEAVPEDTFIYSSPHQKYQKYVANGWAECVKANAYLLPNGNYVSGFKRGTVPIVYADGSNLLDRIEASWSTILDIPELTELVDNRNANNIVAARFPEHLGKVYDSKRGWANFLVSTNLLQNWYKTNNKNDELETVNSIVTKVNENRTYKIYKKSSTEIAISWKNSVIHTISLATINSHKPVEERLSTLPTRIGIVLVGAGGGSGGCTWYDAEKNGKTSDQYLCPGAGGGGGGIIWGVIDISETSSTHPFTVTLGLGGNHGWDASTTNLSHNNPKIGDWGQDGLPTTLSYDNVTLAVAGGGGAGSSGHWSSIAGGGGGGSVETKSQYAGNKLLWWGIAGAKGNDGCSCDPNIENYSAEKNFGIYFLKDETTDGQFTYKIHHDQIKAVSAADITARIPGGHSWGRGGFQDNAPTLGGGGGWGTDSSEDGAEGCFMLFY